MFYIILFLVISLVIDILVNRKNSIFQNIKDSFHNKPEGFSARKLSAFGGFAIAAYIAVQHASPQDVVMLAAAFLLYSLLCLGIVTFEQVIRFREGKSIPSEPTKPTDQPPVV
jgi:predicted histidine transporter YuiF (NhaC family)